MHTYIFCMTINLVFLLSHPITLSITEAQQISTASHEARLPYGKFVVNGFCFVSIRSLNKIGYSC